MKDNIMWAIRCNYPEYRDSQLIGWGWDREVNAPMSKALRLGTALYPSRDLAREMLKKVKKSYPEASITKIKLVEVKR
jgi:hypothetical protein